MEKIELKETLELVKAIEVLGVAGVGIAKDGIGAEDIAPALALVQQASVLVEGFKGLGQVDDEVKDLDEQELVQLGLAAFGAYKKIREAAKAASVA